MTAQDGDRHLLGIAVVGAVVRQHGLAHEGGPLQQPGPGEARGRVGHDDLVGARQRDVDDPRQQLPLRVFLGEPREPSAHDVRPCVIPHG